MSCITNLLPTLKYKITHLFRPHSTKDTPSSSSSSTTSSTLKRHQISSPRNVKKEEDPFGSLLALPGNEGDHAYLLREKTKLTASTTTTTTTTPLPPGHRQPPPPYFKNGSNTSLPPAPDPASLFFPR